MIKIIRYKFILTLLFFSSLNAQSLDSLMDSITGKSPREQIEILNKETWKYRSKNPLYAMSAGKKAIELAEKAKFYKLLAAANNFVGVVNRNLGRFGEAMAHYQQALKNAQLAYDSVQIAYSYNNIGGIYRMQRQFTLALENIFKARNIFEQLKDERGMAFCYINIGIIFRERGEYAKALKFLNKTIEIRKKIGDKFGETLALSHIAELYFKQGKYKQAYLTYLKLLNSYKELDDTKGIAYIYGALSMLLYQEGNYSEALQFRKHALELNRKIMNKEGILISLCELSKIYCKLKNCKEAEKVLKKAEDIMNETDLALAPKYYLNALSEYYFVSDNYKKAFETYLKFDRFRDSLALAEDKVRVAAIESMYNVEKVTREKALLQKDLELKNATQIFLLLISAVSIFFLAIFYFKDKKTRKLNAELRENNSTKDRFFGIIAHDLKNPFNSLLGYSDLLLSDYESFSEEEKKSAIQEMNSATKKLYGLVNNLLDWSRAQTNRMTINPIELNPKKELESIVDIFRPLADQKKITVTINGVEDLRILCDGNIFNTVFRNLINNAIKFTPKGGEIKINVYETLKHIEISVEDNGAGIPEEQLDKLFDASFHTTSLGTDKETGTGLGLVLVKELLDKVKAEIKVESELGKGSKFTVCFPR